MINAKIGSNGRKARSGNAFFLFSSHPVRSVARLDMIQREPNDRVEDSREASSREEGEVPKGSSLFLQIRRRSVLHRGLRRSADQDQPHLEDLQRRQREETVLHIATVAAHHLLRPDIHPDPDQRGLDDHRSCPSDAPLPDDGGQPARLQQLYRRQLRDRLRLPDDTHHRVHRLCRPHEEDPGSLQREQAHR